MAPAQESVAIIHRRLASGLMAEKNGQTCHGVARRVNAQKPSRGINDNGCGTASTTKENTILQGNAAIGNPRNQREVKGTEPSKIDPAN